MKGSLEERFWAKVQPEPNTGCWFWLGATVAGGYGHLGRGRREEGNIRAHCLSWEIAQGPIPAGLVLHHRCDVSSCCNPQHMVAISQSEHMRLHSTHKKGGDAYAVRQKARLTCSRGHVYDIQTTYYYYVKSEGYTSRRCRTCNREYLREHAEQINIRRRRSRAVVQKSHDHAVTSNVTRHRTPILPRNADDDRSGQVRG